MLSKKPISWKFSFKSKKVFLVQKKCNSHTMCQTNIQEVQCPIENLGGKNSTGTSQVFESLNRRTDLNAMGILFQEKKANESIT